MSILSRPRCRTAVRALALIGTSVATAVCSGGGTDEKTCTVSSVSVQPSQVTVAVGTSTTLTAQVTSSNCSTDPAVTWSTSDPVAVTLQPNGNQVQVTGVAPTSVRADLALGRAPATISATAQEQTGTSQVTVVAAPAIALSSSALTFNADPGGANPASQPVTITNGGGGTLSGLGVGTITYGAGATGWLQAPTLNTTSANPSATLTLQPVTGALTAGTYTATVPVTSAVASNSPQNVTVTFVVGTSTTCTPTAYTVGSTVNGTLAASDCHLGDGSYYDAYAFSATATASVRFTLTSGIFDTFLFLTDPAGNLLAFDDDGTGTTNSTFRLLLGTAGYQVGANSFDPATTGAYTLTSATVAANVTNCEDVWLTPGISTAQAIEATDCLDSSGPFYADGYLMQIRAGQSVTITQGSAVLDAFLFLVRIEQDGTTTLVASDNDSGSGTDAVISYTNNGTAAAAFIIFAATNLANETGAYTLTIQ